MRTALALLAVAACADPRGLPPGVSCEQTSGFGWVPVQPRLDVVLVVSDASSMAAYHDRLAANLGLLVTVLSSIEGGLPSLQIAVVDADGGFAHEPLVAGCVPPFGEAIEDIVVPWFWCADADPATGCRDRNYDGTIAETLTCIGTTPADGDAPSALLERARIALTSPDGHAFLRDDAYTMLVLVGVEDDASPRDVAEYADWLHGLHDGDPTRTIVGVIAGDDTPRLDALRGAFPDREVYTPIDRDDWGDVFSVLGGFGPLVPNGCLDGFVDDLDCVASADNGEVLIPPCAMAEPDRPDAATALPCYWIADVSPSEVGCAHRAMLEFVSSPPVGTLLRCECLR